MKIREGSSTMYTRLVLKEKTLYKMFSSTLTSYDQVHLKLTFHLFRPEYSRRFTQLD